MKAIKMTTELKAFFCGIGAIEEEKAAKAFLKKIRAHVRQHKYKNPNATTTIYEPKVKTLFKGNDRVGIADMAGVLKSRFLK